MTIGTLKSPNPRNRISISVIKSKFLSVSSMKFARHFESHWRETWRHTGRRTVPQISLETPSSRWGWPFDFWGGMGNFRNKNILQTHFERNKFLPGNTWRKNSYAEKIPFMTYNAGKKVLHRCLSGKNILSPEVLGKNSFPDQITYTLPPPPPSIHWRNCPVWLIIPLYCVKLLKFLSLLLFYIWVTS